MNYPLILANFFTEISRLNLESICKQITKPQRRKNFVSLRLRAFVVKIASVSDTV